MLWLVCFMCILNQALVVYRVLSADPGWRVEADDGEKGRDLQPTDEQLLICDQVSRQRATCRDRERERWAEAEQVKKH